MKPTYHEEYEVAARRISDGKWVRLSERFKPSEIAYVSQQRFLFWTWERQDIKYDFDTAKQQAVEFAGQYLNGPEYQDVAVICYWNSYTGYGEWGDGPIWKNGKWL